ncbi:MAG: tRNA glutamyl-Q(34) synthetase GluQRS [Sphingosinicella sp.]|uniref:tRNA glutamyl-Q(34) synthetase GluQRS n=1 Tax=Sphingosinicella sp. TaxID=1917971 RepID=UPI004037DADC
MQIVTRFAPSPTGRLHLGHAYSALLAHDFAREAGGAFLLRIEDIDPGRARTEYVDGIIADMLWLGLEWDDEIVYQSERLETYAEALERLKERRLVYPCFCTRADIAASVAAPHGPDGPIYPGTCRGLADLDLAQPHAWRLDVAKAMAETGPLYWMDEQTEVQAEPDRFGDVVLARKDAPASYHLAVTVDDAALGVTDVVRGRDLYTCTDIHRLLQALLELPTPLYHHHALLADANGDRLAKRHGAPTIADLRDAGTDPAQLVEGMRAGQMPAGYSLAKA